MERDRDEVLDQLVEAINIRLDIPKVPEAWEAWLIRLVLAQTVWLLSDAQLELLANLEDGVSNEEIVRMTDLLTNVVVRYIPLPRVPEAMRSVVVSQILGAALVYLARGMSLMETEPAS